MTLDLTTSETPIPLEAIGRRFKVSHPTVWRWVLRGLPGPDGQRVRLEALRVGRRWMTSLEAAQRFFAATTPDLADEPAAAPRSAGKREKAASKASRQLERLGL